VVISRDGSTAASCGWYKKTTQDTGFVFAYGVNGAQTSRTLAYFITGSQARGNMVALSADGSVLAAGADQLYVFNRNGQAWTGPVIIAYPNGDTGDYVTAVGISGDGTRVVALTANGYVMLTSHSGGAWSKAASWKIANGELHAIAISLDGSAFVAGATTSAAGATGKSNDAGTVLYFNTQTFSTSSNPAPGWSQTLAGCNSCRAVALSDDASYFSAAGGAPTELDPPSAGGFVMLGQTANQGSILWGKPLMRSPNSTSLDSQALFVTVSDGFPDPSPQKPLSPGHFYVFDRHGEQRGIATTNMMNWPMQISADASAVVGGSDNGRVFYWKRKTESGPLIG
jgi:WD40 repeat protein